VEKAWDIYEVASRMALEVVAGCFSLNRLRESNYALGVRLSHLFLNTLGYNTGDEYMVHRFCLQERAATILGSSHDRQHVLDRMGGLLNEAPRALNEELSDGPR